MRRQTKSVERIEEMERLIDKLNKSHACKKKERKKKMAKMIKEQIINSHIHSGFYNGMTREEFGVLKPGMYKVRIYKFEDRGFFVYVTFKVVSGDCKDLLFLECFPMPTQCGKLRTASEQKLADLVMVSNLDLVLDIDQLSDIEECHVDLSSDFFVRIGKVKNPEKYRYQIRDYFLHAVEKNKRSIPGYFRR